MKNFEQLTSAIQNMNATDFAKIANNANEFDAEHATNHEKLALLFFDELAKAINTKSEKVVLQINDAQSRAKTKVVTFAYYRTQSVTIQICVKSHAVNICTSARDAYRSAIIEAVTTQTASKCNDTTEFQAIAFENVASVIKTIISAVTAVNNKHAIAKAEAQKASAEAKADAQSAEREKAIADYAKAKRAKAKADAKAK